MTQPPTSDTNGSVLVVDDDPVSLRLHAVLLQRMGFSVQTAPTGHQAFEIITEGKTDMILLDLVLPDMSGFEIVERIRTHSSERYISIIVVSASTDVESIEHALDLGADDYVTKPIQLRDLSARVRNVVRIRRMENQLRMQARHLERELDMAKQIQAHLFPDNPVQTEQLEICWHWQPSMFVAGDILDVFHCGPNRTLFYLADVSGHGVTAAMLSIWLNRHFRAWIEPMAENPVEQSLPHLLATLDTLVAETQTGQYFSLFLGVFDAGREELWYCNAGHPPAQIFSSGENRALGPTAGPVGFGLGMEFDVARCGFPNGASLVVWTDGVSEARTSDGTFFGEKRAIRAAQTAVQKDEDIPTSISRTLQSFLTGTQPEDDVTILSVRRHQQLPQK